MKYIFLYKELNTEDRDCVAYIRSNANWFECEHYFREINIEGPCYSMSLEDIEYNNIKTILSEDEFNQIKLFNKKIKELGYGIIKEDYKYKLGIQYIKDITPIFDKLNSEANEILFNEVIKEEREYLKSNFKISDDDIDFIFDNYKLDYRDRGIIASIYDNEEDLAKEYLYDTENIPDYLIDYIDYKGFGIDLLQEQCYLRLNDNRVVYLNY